MTTPEKVAYLKGLADGLGLDTQKKEDRLFAAIIDVLEDIALDLAELEETTLDLGDELDELADDLSELEEDFEEALEDDDDDCCCCCDTHHGKHKDDDDCDCDCDCCCDCDDDDTDMPMLFEIKCPACENEITIDDQVLALGKINCPNCKELLEFDLDGIEDTVDAD